MTKQVRTSYRRHRKTTWVVVLALVGVIAAVVIPLANAGGKTYKLTATQPAACASPASTEVKLKNTGSPQTLGSAEIYFPSLTVASATLGDLRPDSTSSAQPQKKDILRLDGLNLAPGAERTITVTFKPGAAFSAAITAVAKQANRFSDAGGGANIFDHQGSFPTVTVSGCVNVSGRVFLDNDGDGQYDAAGTPADAGQGGWSVALFRTSSPAGQVGSSVLSASTGELGMYTFTGVPVGADYKVCVTPPSGSGSWSQTTPTGSTSCTGSALPKGQPVTGLVAGTDRTGVNFGNEQTVVPSCTAPFSAPLIGTGAGIFDYKAQLTAPPGTSGCKAAVVMYSYLDSNGSPWATIHPPAVATDTTDFWVVERLRWKVDEDGAQNPVTLKYDDTKPYGDSLAPMKMCTSDPRSGEFGLAVNPATVMPSGETTCEIRSTDLPSGDPYNYEAYTVTIVDGLKGR
jgi:hypothetical protein